jgi:hypothetical protein
MSGEVRFAEPSAVIGRATSWKMCKLHISTMAAFVFCRTIRRRPVANSSTIYEVTWTGARKQNLLLSEWRRINVASIYPRHLLTVEGDLYILDEPHPGMGEVHNVYVTVYLRKSNYSRNIIPEERLSITSLSRAIHRLRVYMYKYRPGYVRGPHRWIHWDSEFHRILINSLKGIQEFRLYNINDTFPKFVTSNFIFKYSFRDVITFAVASAEASLFIDKFGNIRQFRVLKYPGGSNARQKFGRGITSVFLFRRRSIYKRSKLKSVCLLPLENELRVVSDRVSR